MIFETIHNAINVDGEIILLVVFVVLFALLVLGATGLVVRSVVPGLMTSTGIAGTFWGIFIALNPTSTETGITVADIDVLISGMTTAFTTSLIGIASAIVCKTYWSRRRYIDKDITQAQIGLADRLDEIKLAIRSDGELSLSEHVHALRSESQEGHSRIANLADTIENTLARSINEMTEQVREALVDNLTNALKDLMVSLEDTLVKQFGKTFAEFNVAVHALNEWQKDHREHVKELTEAYETVVIGIQQIQESCAPLPETADKLKDIVATATKHTNELNASILAFADLSKQAQEAPQMIKEYLDKIGQDLHSSASGFAKLEGEIAGIYVAGKKAADEHAKNVDKLVAKMTEKLNESVSFISDHSTQQITAVGTEVGKLAVNMRTTMESSQRETSNRVAGIIKGSMDRLDGQVERELNRTATIWGNHMLSIARALEEKTKSKFK